MFYTNKAGKGDKRRGCTSVWRTGKRAAELPLNVRSRRCEWKGISPRAGRFLSVSVRRLTVEVLAATLPCVRKNAEAELAARYAQAGTSMQIIIILYHS